MWTLVPYVVGTALLVGLWLAATAVIAWWKGGASAGGPPPMRPVPVGTATAQRGDMQIFLAGLGTVTPLKTVTIRSRVDGELVKVLFNEGDVVKEGQILAEINRVRTRFNSSWRPPSTTKTPRRWRTPS
ncbi:MAG: biotin/lipoyl-binding protein [Pirellulales bacterium]